MAACQQCSVFPVIAIIAVLTGRWKMWQQQHPRGRKAADYKYPDGFIFTALGGIVFGKGDTCFLLLSPSKVITTATARAAG